MQKYAQLTPNGVVDMCVESETDPDGINGEWTLCGEEVGPGFTFDLATLTFSPPVPPVNSSEWLLDVGALNNRFGSAKLPILMSADPVIKAFNSDKSDRHWIDLKDPELISVLGYLAGEALPGIGTIAEPLISQADKARILTTPVTPFEQLAAVRQFFS